MALPFNPQDLQEISEALRVRPRALLLGQAFLGGPTGDDALAVALRTQYPNAAYPHAWWLTNQDDIKHRISAFTSAEKASLVPQELRTCLRQPWTAVLTSAIGSLPRSLLEIPNRRLVHQLTVPGFHRREGDSILLYRLFGTLDRVSESEAPPMDMDGLRRRRLQAAEILQDLPSIVSVHGHVFVDGWDPSPGADWLRPRELATTLASLDRGQALIFGVDVNRRSALENDEDFNELIRLGIVRVYEPRLHECVAELLKANLVVTDDDWTTRAADTVIYELAEKIPRKGVYAERHQVRTIPIAINEWRRLSSTLKILEELDQTRSLPRMTEEQHHLFRTLCARGPDTSIWPWLPHLAFRRAVLDKLVDEAIRLCQERAPQEHVIVVHGQSGAGKTVLLHLLALELRRLGLPVLFATRALLPVDQTHVDEFCSLLAQHSAIGLPVFFLYDATQSEGEYLELASFLSGRNRKCVVIGSAYPGHMSAGTPRRRRRHIGVTTHPIEVSVTLSTRESQDFLAHIQKYTGVAIDALRGLLGTDIAHFFAILYRLLPETRTPLSAGLIDELTQGSARIEKRIEEERRAAPEPAMGVMELKLRAALSLALQDVASIQDNSESADKSRTAARRLIDAVMVASRFGLSLPQSIALRLIGTNIPAYRSSMKGDIIVEREVERGVFVLEGRHPLEAEIWVRDRISEPKRRFDIIRSMVLHIRGSEAIEDSVELEFVVKMLQAIGPEGRSGLRMTAHYHEIADIVGELRLRHDVHPRLLLVEAHTIREWILIEQRQLKDRADSPEAIERLETWLVRLDRADEGLRRAVDMVAQDGGAYMSAAARRMLTTLATERAAVLGFKLGSAKKATSVTYRSRPAVAADPSRWLIDARSAWREALRYDDENYRALYTAGWVLRDRIDLGNLDPVEEAEILAEWAEIVDRYLDLEIPASELDRQDHMEAEFSQYAKDLSRFQAAMDRAVARGSSAIHVLVARGIRTTSGAVAARNYLEVNCRDAIRRDRSVLLLYTRLWWECETGLHSYIDEERAQIGLSREKWETLEQLTTSRLRLEGEADNPVAHFLRACALVHLGSVDDALKAFDYLARLGLGGFRRSRSLMLLCDEQGRPRLLTAEFQGRRQGTIYLAWCDELRANVRFNPLDHNLVEPRPGTWLRGFHLALSFRGIYAEPPRRLRESRS